MARTYEVIQSEIRKLQQEAQAALVNERNEAIARIRADMAKFDISVDDLRGHVQARHKGAPAKNRVPGVTQKSDLAPKGASDDSPAVRLLEDAGIDFRRKTPTGAAPQKAAAKVGSRARGGSAR